MPNTVRLHRVLTTTPEKAYRALEEEIVTLRIPPGSVVGELALLSPDKARTQSLKCEESGEILEITYTQIKQLYYQNPKFGFYLMELTGRRLFDNIKRLEAEVEQLRGRLAASGDEAFAH